VGISRSHRLAAPAYRSALAALLALGAAIGPAAAAVTSPSQVLRESWKAYVSRFIQADGRVIDFAAEGISTSEGQSYAMLRAVWLRDRAVFDRTYAWGRRNLNAGVRKDRLWAWKWGKSSDGQWQVLDAAFASDADQDVALALILAFQTWKDERYKEEAQAILEDLWTLATQDVNGRRFLLAGDKLCQGQMCRLNPSYYAPYAYRIFALYDRSRNWRALADSSYFVLARAAELTATRLPPDWIVLDTTTGRLSLPEGKLGSFSYDALRVYWRVAMDWEIFREPRADRYLKETLPWLISQWERSGTLPAVVSSSGQPLANYESGEMLAALMPAMRGPRPDIAAAMQRKLRSAYKSGLWADQAGVQHTYYLQNWAWFGTALYEEYLAPFRPFQAKPAAPSLKKNSK
jgi:endo-1,4-beta-D-glucanase Y